MTDVATMTNAGASTALTVQERASLALNITDERLATLRAVAEKSAGIVRITNADGYKEVHAARMALKNLRLDIEKTGEKAREDAQAFAKAIIAGQKTLLAQIEPEEQRLKALQDAEDERVEAEKKKARDAEQARIAGIQQKIEWIRNRALELVGKPIDEVAAAIFDLEGLPITDELFGEFTEQAGAARALVLDKLRAMHGAAAKAKIDADAIAEQRAELARKQEALDAEDRARSEQRRREDAERKTRQDAEDAERKAKQDAEDAERKAKQDAEDAERKAAAAYAQAWDDAHAEDRLRAELAVVAERLRARQAAELEAAEQRRKERAELEAKADPWAALERIRTHATTFDPVKAPASALCGILDEIQTECDATLQYRAELEANDAGYATAAEYVQAKRAA